MDHALYLLEQLPEGRLLNLGAMAGRVSDTRFVVNVDLAIPDCATGIWVQADAMNLPFRDGAFDGALLKDIVEHLSDAVGALREARRVVAVGAPITVEVPRAIARAVWADPTHVRGFTAKAITTALVAAGWHASRPIRVGGFPGAGRLGLIPHLTRLMRIPLFGHWFGINWLVEAR